MYEVQITSTGRPYGPKGEYRIFNEGSRRFRTKELVKQFLDTEYGSCKKTKMFSDNDDGSVKEIGYVYCFHNTDCSHSPVEKWLQQEWVTIVHFEPETCLLT